MSWNSFAEFAVMGGYGLYVWGSVLAVAGGLALELALLALRSRSAAAAVLAARGHAAVHAAADARLQTDASQADARGGRP